MQARNALTCTRVGVALEQGAVWTTQRAPRGDGVTAGPKRQGKLSDDQYEPFGEPIVGEPPVRGARQCGRPMCWKRAVDWNRWGSRRRYGISPHQKEAAAREVALAFVVPPMADWGSGACDLCQFHQECRIAAFIG